MKSYIFFLHEINYHLHEKAETFSDLQSFPFWNPFIPLCSSHVITTAMINSNKPRFISLLQSMCLCHSSSVLSEYPYLLHTSFLCLVQRFPQTSRLRWSLTSYGLFLYSHHVNLNYPLLYKTEHLSHHQIHVVKEN